MDRTSQPQSNRPATRALKTAVLRCFTASHDSLRRAITDADHFLSWSISCLRGATILALLFVTLLQPARGRLDQYIELNILIFAVYDIVIEVIRRRFPARQGFAWVTLLDLPVVTALYSLGAAPGGLMFTLVFLAVVCAAVTLQLRWSLLYTLGITAMVVVIDPTFPLWSQDAGDMRRLSGRLLVIWLTSIGTAILTLRLRLERDQSLAHREQALEQTKLNRLRDEFVAMISHDLRTPLAGARAGISMLEASARARLEPDEQELLRSTRRNIQRLGRLIDDLLVLNQLEAGVLQLERERVDLRRVVADILPAMHPLITDKGQTLEVDLPEQLLVWGDTRRLDQVILNLVANAHQHTPAGTRIVITGSVEHETVRLGVCDTGPGISPDEREAIFERFYQVGKGRGAAGLGLAIVKGLVELHNGRVWVESTPGTGTTFYVELPRDRSGDVKDA